MASDLSQHIEVVARQLWGEPNRAYTRGNQLRWGTNGARSIDIAKGVWSDHAEEHASINAGGVLDLIKREKSLANGEAFDWMRIELGIKFEGEPIQKTAKREPIDRGRLVATYDYVDESGAVISQTLRYEKPGPDGGKPTKTFMQRRPDGAGGHVYNLRDVRLVPYRLPEVSEAVALGHRIFVVEGEKAADLLWSSGVPATCNPMGAKKWPTNFADYFKGAVVTVLPDNDVPGLDHGRMVAANLAEVADVRIVELPGLGEKEDIVEWLGARGGTIESLNLLAEVAPAYDPNAPKPYVPRFAPMGWRDVFAPVKAYPWLIKGMLPEREATLMYGAPQTGKSFLMQDTALCVARGLPVFGRTTKRAGVVYCAFEGGRGFRKRQLAYAKQHGLDADADIPMVVLTRRADLFGDTDFDPLCIEIDQVARLMTANLGLIVFDTWSAATPGANENASEDVSKTRAKVMATVERFGCSVVVVHHKPAAGGKPRGHTSLTGDFETTIDVDWAEGFVDPSGRRVRTADLTKQREGETGPLGKFLLNPVTVGIDDEGADITSCVVAMPEDAVGTGAKQPKGRLSDRAKIGLQALRDALGEHGEPAPGALQLPHSVRVVRYEKWREIAQRRLGDPEEQKSSEALRKAMARVGEELMARRIIARDNPFVWIVREPS